MNKEIAENFFLNIQKKSEKFNNFRKISDLEEYKCQKNFRNTRKVSEFLKKNIAKFRERFMQVPPVTISLSDRPSNFFQIRYLTRSASDHTMVSQTGFFAVFFQTHFRP